jgi:hypothetical protein
MRFGCGAAAGFLRDHGGQFAAKNAAHGLWHFAEHDFEHGFAFAGPG